jgi:hypothetical protein
VTKSAQAARITTVPAPELMDVNKAELCFGP